MYGYQFAHIQTYSRKGNKVSRSLTDVLKENSRVPGNMNHIKEPGEPELIFGKNPVDLIPIIDQLVATAKERLKGTGQRIQSNTHVLEGAVFSHPYTVESLREDPDREADYQSWRKDMIKYAIADAEKRGLKTLSIVEHRDEPYPHIHVLSVPMLTADNPRVDAKRCHRGHIASSEAAQQGKNPKAQMAAYREAMSEWQNDLWEAVSVKHGLTRLGPRRKRYTRTEYHEQKQAALKVKQLYEIKEKLEAEIGNGQSLKAENKLLKSEVNALKTELDALSSDFSDFKQKADAQYQALRDKATGIITELQAQLDEQNRPTNRR